MAIVKGIDGVYADYTMPTYESLALLGSRSNWPQKTMSLSSSYIYIEASLSSSLMTRMAIFFSSAILTFGLI